MKLDQGKCIENWLQAREEFLKGRGGHEVLDRFDDANRELFVAFVEDWVGDTDTRTIAKAFSEFRKMLTQEADKANLTRMMRYHPFPIVYPRA